MSDVTEIPDPDKGVRDWLNREMDKFKQLEAAAESIANPLLGADQESLTRAFQWQAEREAAQVAVRDATFALRRQLAELAADARRSNRLMLLMTGAILLLTAVGVALTVVLLTR